MFVLGLILILIATLLILAAVLGGADDQADFVLGSMTLEYNVAVFFLTGALTLLILVLGLMALRIAARRSRARRRESKELNKVSKKLEQREAELRQERGNHPTSGTGDSPTRTETRSADQQDPRDPPTR